MPGLNFKGTSKYQKFTDNMLRKTHFTETEIDRLAELHSTIMNTNNYTGKIDRKRFRDFLNDNFELTEEVIIDRIYNYFNTEAKDDIDLEEWVLGFNVILKGSLSEQIQYCFTIYDLNDDGYISREEMLTMMGSCLSKVKSQQVESEEDEGIKDLIEMTVKKMDYDKDGRISLEDFTKTVEEDILLLEAFGICLPSSQAGKDFLKTILDFKDEQ